MLALRESAEDPTKDNNYAYEELQANEISGKSSNADDSGGDFGLAPVPSVAPPTGFTESGIIDVTDTFDGMPIDISSPHLNVGEHREALYQAAALAREEAEKAAYEEAERIEAAKEILLEEALSEEAERQFYEQHLHNQYHLAQADAMKQHYEEEEAAFQAEQLLRQEQYQRGQQEHQYPLSPPPGNAHDEEQRQQQQQQWLEDNENEASFAPPLGAFSPEPPGLGVSMPDVLADLAAAADSAAADDTAAAAAAAVAVSSTAVSPGGVTYPLNSFFGNAKDVRDVNDSVDLDNVLRQPVALDFDHVSVAEDGNDGNNKAKAIYEEPALDVNALSALAVEECEEVEVKAEKQEEEEEALEEELSAPLHHSPPPLLPRNDGVAEEVEDTADEVIHDDAGTNSLRGRSSPEQLVDIVEDRIDDDAIACDATAVTERESFDARSPVAQVSEAAVTSFDKELTPPEAATPPVKRLLNRIVGTSAGSIGTPPVMPTPPPTEEVVDNIEQPSPPHPSSSSPTNAASPESPLPPPALAPPPLLSSSLVAPSSQTQDEARAAPNIVDRRKVQLRATSRIPRLRTRPFAVWQQDCSLNDFSSSSPRSFSTATSAKVSGLIDGGDSSSGGGDGFLSAFLLAAGVAPAQAVRATAALRSAGLSHKSHDKSKVFFTANSTDSTNATTSSDARSVFGVPGSAQRTKAAGVLRSAGAKASALKAVFALVDKLTTQEDDFAAAAGPGEALNAARRNAAVKPVTAAAAAPAPATAAPAATASPAPASASTPAPAVERRIDPADGEAYTKEEFVEEYGANCVEWDTAKRTAPRQVSQATPPGPEENAGGDPTSSVPAATAVPGVKPTGGEKRSKSLDVRKPRDDPTAWAEKRRLKTEKAKELREAKRFGM